MNNFLRKSKIQLVGMSATLPNLKVLSDWLDASLYQTDYRPIELHEYFSLEGSVYDMDSKKLKEIKINQDIMNQDKELVAHLVNYKLPLAKKI